MFVYLFRLYRSSLINPLTDLPQFFYWKTGTILKFEKLFGPPFPLSLNYFFDQSSGLFPVFFRIYSYHLEELNAQFKGSVREK